jgi:hypothetical protein
VSHYYRPNVVPIYAVIDLLMKYIVCINKIDDYSKSFSQFSNIIVVNVNNVNNKTQIKSLILIKKIYILNNKYYHYVSKNNIFVSSDFIHFILLNVSIFVCTKSNVKHDFVVGFWHYNLNAEKFDW